MYFEINMTTHSKWNLLQVIKVLVNFFMKGMLTQRIIANKSSIRWECSQRMSLSCKCALNSDLLVSTFMLYINYHFITKLSTVIPSWHLIACIGEL